MSAPVLSVEQMRQWEAVSWANGISQAEVIRQAGLAVAARARKMTQVGERILIVAGKGNNGADARQARAGLEDRDVLLLNVAQLENAPEKLSQAVADKPALIIDGLFGIGLDRPLDEFWIRLIQQINQSGCPVLAVDVPSGLDADTGEVRGAAIRATTTVTFGGPKRGMLLHPAWPYVGRLEVAAEIGLSPCPFISNWQWTLPEDFRRFPPPRPVAAHKGTFGHAVLVAGNLGYHGAAVLAARGAQRAMPGLISLFTPDASFPLVASQLQAVMVNPLAAETRLPDAGALLFGPGLAGRDLPGNLKHRVRRAWQYAPCPVVMDASALDWLPTEPRPHNEVRVMTPHPGEAARLLEVSPKEIQENRPGAVRELSRSWGDCLVVLKGHQTLIGRSEGDLFFNSSGNPLLAQGGSGDVLAGYLTGLLAQLEFLHPALEAVRYAVWQHGAAADLLSALQPAWTTEELISKLGLARPD